MPPGNGYSSTNEGNTSRTGRRGMMARAGQAAANVVDRLYGKVKDSVTGGDPTTEDERALQKEWIEGRFEPAKKKLKPYWTKQEESRRLYAGDGYTYLDPKSGRVMQANMETGGYPDRRANYYMVFVNRKATTLIEDRAFPDPVAGEGGGLDAIENRNAADTAKSVCQHVDYVAKVEREEARAAKKVTIEGSLWGRVWWDASLFAKFKVEGQDGKYTVENRQDGDIRITLYDDREFIIDPFCKDVRDAGWGILVCDLTISKIRELFPETGAYVDPNRRGDYCDNPIKEAIQGRVRAFVSDKDVLSACVPVWYTWRRVWEREKDKVSWVEFVFCKGVTLRKETPTTFFPWVRLMYSADIDDPILGWTPQWDMKTIQREITQTQVAMAVDRKTYMNKKLVYVEGTIPEDQLDNTAAPIKLSRHTDIRSAMPQMLETKLDSQGLSQHMATQVLIARDITNNHEIQSGISDPTVKSGKHADIVIGQDKGDMLMPLIEWWSGWQEIWEKVLELADSNYEEDRLLYAITGPDKAVQVRDFKKGYLNQISRVIMRRGSRIPLSAQARIELSRFMLENGLYHPDRKAELRRFYEANNWPFSEPEIDEERSAIWQQQEEIEAMRAGGEVTVGEDENHTFHEMVCDRWINSTTFLKEQPVVQDAALMHRDRHKELRQAQEAEEAEHLGLVTWLAQGGKAALDAQQEAQAAQMQQQAQMQEQQMMMAQAQGQGPETIELGRKSA